MQVGQTEVELNTAVLWLSREGASERRQYLGTHMKDAAGRELYQLWLDLDARRIEAIPERWMRALKGRELVEPLLARLLRASPAPARP